MKISQITRQKLIDFIIAHEKYGFENLDMSTWAYNLEHGIVGLKDYTDDELISNAEQYIDMDSPSYIHDQGLINLALAEMAIDTLIND